MSEALTLTTPVPPTPGETKWSVDAFFMSISSPTIRVDLLSDTGARAVYLLQGTDAASIALINTALSFINQGKFQTVQGKSLQRWLLERISADGFKVGTVTGTPV